GGCARLTARCPPVRGLRATPKRAGKHYPRACRPGRTGTPDHCFRFSYALRLPNKDQHHVAKSVLGIQAFAAPFGKAVKVTGHITRREVFLSPHISQSSWPLISTVALAGFSPVQQGARPERTVSTVCQPAPKPLKRLRLLVRP